MSPWVRSARIAGVAVFLIWTIPAGPAWAIDLNLEVRVAAPVDEPTMLVITGFKKVMPVEPAYHATEIAAESTSGHVNIADVDPGVHELEVSQAGVRRTFRFTIHPDGVIVFDPAPGLTQQANTITLWP